MLTLHREISLLADSNRTRRRAGESAPPTGPAFPRVAQTLRELRKTAGLTQEQFASLVGLTFAGYRPYERGERDLTGSQIESWAALLGIPVSDITSRLWPDDARLVETRYSHDWAELQRQVEHLPSDQQERILRLARQSLELAMGAADLARRN